MEPDRWGHIVFTAPVVSQSIALELPAAAHAPALAPAPTPAPEMLPGGPRDRVTAQALAVAYPKLAAAALADADAALAGMLVLPGTGSHPRFTVDPPD